MLRILILPELKFIKLLVTGIFLLTACKYGKADKDQIPIKIAVQQRIVKPSSSFQDTLKIAASSAVFFHPDTLQFERFKAENNEMVNKSVEHDCFYQMRNARTVLAKYYPKVNIIECRNKRFIQFFKKDHSEVVVDLDKRDVCGLFLFDRIKDPQVVDMMNIDSELPNYFVYK